MSTASLTARAIGKIIRELDEDGEWQQFLSEEFKYEDLDEFKNGKEEWAKDYIKFLEELESKLNGRIKLISSERSSGSGDWDGYEWTLELDGRYFQIYGYYSSWDGYDCSDWYDLNEVKKVTKTIEVFEPI